MKKFSANEIIKEAKNSDSPFRDTIIFDTWADTLREVANSQGFTDDDKVFIEKEKHWEFVGDAHDAYDRAMGIIQ